jgi:hypothetical protein
VEELGPAAVVVGVGLEAASYRFARAFAYAAANQLSLANPPRLARD